MRPWSQSLAGSSPHNDVRLLLLLRFLHIPMAFTFTTCKTLSYHVTPRGRASRTLLQRPTSFTCLTTTSHKLHNDTMSRQYTDSWRPAQNKPSYQNNYNRSDNSNSKNRHPHLVQDARNDRADDQIAPKHASNSVQSLQRWALATANLPQQGHRSNETQIIERIERRYASEDVNRNEPSPRYSNDSGGHAEREGTPYARDVLHKRQRSISISPPTIRRMPARDRSAVAHVRDAKRRRTRSPSLPRYRGSAEQ